MNDFSGIKLNFRPQQLYFSIFFMQTISFYHILLKYNQKLIKYMNE